MLDYVRGTVVRTGTGQIVLWRQECAAGTALDALAIVKDETRKTSSALRLING